MTSNSTNLTSGIVHVLIESQTGLISIFFLIFVNGTASKSPIVTLNVGQYAYYGYGCAAIYISMSLNRKNLTYGMVTVLIESQTGLISIFFLIFAHDTASYSPITPFKDGQ